MKNTRWLLAPVLPVLALITWQCARSNPAYSRNQSRFQTLAAQVGAILHSTGVGGVSGSASGENYELTLHLEYPLVPVQGDDMRYLASTLRQLHAYLTSSSFLLQTDGLNMSEVGRKDNARLRESNLEFTQYLPGGYRGSGVSVGRETTTVLISALYEDRNDANVTLALILHLDRQQRTLAGQLHGRAYQGSLHDRKTVPTTLDLTLDGKPM